MITPVFNDHDTNFYSTWRSENSGIVCLIVPGVGEVRMSLSKAEEIADSLKRQAEYGRWAAERMEAPCSSDT